MQILWSVIALLVTSFATAGCENYLLALSDSKAWTIKESEIYPSKNSFAGRLKGIAALKQSLSSRHLNPIKIAKEYKKEFGNDPYVHEVMTILMEDFKDTAKLIENYLSVYPEISLALIGNAEQIRTEFRTFHRKLIGAIQYPEKPVQILQTSPFYADRKKAYESDYNPIDIKLTEMLSLELLAFIKSDMSFIDLTNASEKLNQLRPYKWDVEEKIIYSPVHTKPTEDQLNKTIQRKKILDQVFDPENPDILGWIESSYFSSLRAHVGEVDVALSIDNVIGSSVQFFKLIDIDPELRKFNLMWLEKVYQKAILLDEAIQNGTIETYYQLYPHLFAVGKRYRDLPPQDLKNFFLRRILDKEIDIVSIDKHGRYIFTEVKTSRTLYGEKLTVTKDAIYQYNLTREILQFLDLENEVSIQMAFPYGITEKAIQEFKNHGIAILGK